MKIKFCTFKFSIILVIASCNIDEIPPEIASNLIGWFTIEDNNIGVNLAWSASNDNDFSRYVVFRSKDNSMPIEIGETKFNYFKDSEIEWLQYYKYFIKSIDEIGNESELSDSIIIRTYSASGNWKLSNFDSTYLCIEHNQIISTSSGLIEQKGYFLSDGYSLLINDASDDSTSSIGDTILSKMLFSYCNIDSGSWTGNGWMTYQNTILDTTILGDTINVTTNNFPVYFNINLLKPEAGTITFSSPFFEELFMEHALEYCNGDNIFN